MTQPACPCSAHVPSCPRNVPSDSQGPQGWRGWAARRGAPAVGGAGWLHPVGSCRCVAPCPPAWTSHGVTEHPHGAHPVLTQGTEPSPRWSRQHPGTGVSADAGGRCLLGSVGWVWPCRTPAGLQPGLALAPSIPHPHQLCRYHPRDIATGPVDIFLVAVSQQMPKSLSSWGYRKRGPLHGADSVWPISGKPVQPYSWSWSKAQRPGCLRPLGRRLRARGSG